MASGGSSQKHFRKAIKAIKDSTSVGIAKVNSDYKKIKVSILKATNHAEVLPKEKHVRAILRAVSGSRPRADVAYCIHTLTKRLSKTHSWMVALKTLIVIHRALREVDHSFCEELIYHNQCRSRLLNLLHFKDDSSPIAWEYSTWIRTYALYIEECLECFRVLKYDFYRDHTRTKKFNIPALLEQLPPLQQLLFRLLCVQPVGEARHNFIIQYALSIVAAESVRLYVAITDGVLILVEKFFEMQRRDAVRTLEIYRNAGEQAQRLSEFFEMCRSLEFGRRQKYVKIEQPPASFLKAMEEYIKEAPQKLMLPWEANDDVCDTPRLIAVPDPKQAISDEGSHSSNDSQDTSESDQADAPPLIPDLWSWDEPAQEASEPDEKNPLPLVLATPENLSNNVIDSELSSEPASWELALVTTSGSDATSPTLTKGGVLDRSLLDSLYDVEPTKPCADGPLQTSKASSSNPFEADDYAYDQNMFYNGYTHNQNMFYDPSLIVHPSFMQAGGAHQKQEAFVPHHDHQEQSMVPYDYAQVGGTHPQQPAFTEQYYQQQYPQIAGKQQESWMAGHDFVEMTEMPQVEGKSVVLHDSTNEVGNPSEEKISLPVVPQAQNPSFDFSFL